MQDRMEIGDFIPLEDGWFLDTNTNTRFTLDEEGNPVDENGQLLIVEGVDNDKE